MNIRVELPTDIDAVRYVEQVAFQNHPHSNGQEYAVVDGLRESGALTLSLVTEVDGLVVGHIAFSPVTISGTDYGWYGLGPVAVLPEYQSRGIGSALVREGLRLLREQGAAGVVLLGEPEYYSRFGFKAIPALQLEGVPSEYFLALPLGINVPPGIVRYHSAFDAVA